MTTLSILSKADGAAFESPPVFTSEDRKYFFSPPQWAHELLTSFPTVANKLVFLLQLGYFRASKKFYSPHNVPEADIAFVTARFQLGDGFDLRHFSKTTLHRHRVLIRERLGYRPFAALHAAKLTQEVDFLLSKQGKMKDIFTRLLQLLE